VAYHKPSNIEMPRRLLRCLNGLDWLNDEVMNIYMGLLQVCTHTQKFLLYSCAVQLSFRFRGGLVKLLMQLIDVA